MHTSQVSFKKKKKNLKDQENLCEQEQVQVLFCGFMWLLGSDNSVIPCNTCSLFVFSAKKCRKTRKTRVKKKSKYKPSCIFFFGN